MRRIRIAVLLLAVAGALCVPRRAQAAPITVNSTSDSGPGNCTATCTLRDAISTAASGDTIDFSVVGTITLNGTEIAFGKDLTINGPGARILTVSGAGASRILNISSGTVTITGLTFAGASGPDFGGAILSAGTLNLARCAFSGNTSATVAGAVYNNHGTLNVAGCTFSGNSASLEGAVGSSGTTNIAASTFSGNSATSGFAGTLGVAAGTMNLVNSTFSGNSAALGAAYYTNPGTNNTIRNTIFNSETGGDCVFGSGGTLTGADNMSDGSCPGTLGTVTGFDATLRDNGGPTDTFLVVPPGNAVDAAGGCAYPADFTASIFNSAADQRGIPRPLGSACDIGAVEAFAFTPAALPTGVLGMAYSQAIGVAGGTAPYDFIESGALPAGTTLTPAGLLSGPPTELGSFPILVTATDTNGFKGQQSYTLDVLAPTPTPTITPTSVPSNTPTNTPNPIPAVPTLNNQGTLLFGLLVAGAGLLLLIRRR